MAIELHLHPKLEKRLIREATDRGVTVEDYAKELLASGTSSSPDHLGSKSTEKSRSKDAIALLQSWLDDPDTTEQRETGQYLLEVLDQDRLSERLLFPPELKGITW